MFILFKRYFVINNKISNDSQYNLLNKIVTKAGSYNFVLFLVLGFIYFFSEAVSHQLNKILFIVYYILVFFYFLYFASIISKFHIKKITFDNSLDYYQKLKQIRVLAVINSLIFFYCFIFKQLFFNTEIATTKEIIETIIFYIATIICAIIMFYFIHKNTLHIKCYHIIKNKPIIVMKDKFLQVIIGYVDETDSHKVTQLYRKLANLNIIFFYLQLGLLIVYLIYSCFAISIDKIYVCLLFFSITTNVLYSYYLLNE